MLQITSLSKGVRLPNPAILIFLRPIRAILSHINRRHINYNPENKNYKALKSQLDKCSKNSDTHRDRVYSIHAKRGWWTIDALGDCQGQHCRPQWVITQSEGDEDGHTYKSQHKAHAESTNNNKIVPQTAV